MSLGMKLTAQYVWSDDIIALRNEKEELFLQLDGALSMHTQKPFLEPFFIDLYTWLATRMMFQQADLPPDRRGGKFAVQLRGDDILEGMCVAACRGEGAGSMDKNTERYFLKHVRPPWKLICAVKEL